MSCTISYHGTLKNSITPEAVFNCIPALTERLDCHLYRESGAMTVFFNKGTSEPLVFEFVNNKMNGFCKWNGETVEEIYSIFDIFLRIRPLFKSLKVEDDEGIWHSYLVRDKPCRIKLRLPESDSELQLLQRMLMNQTTPPDELEAFILTKSRLRPFHLSFLRAIIQDFIKIMDYHKKEDFHPETILMCADAVGCNMYPHVIEHLENFEFVFSKYLLLIWFSYAFIYKNNDVVYKIPEETYGFKTSKRAALFGTLSLFLNCHSGGADNTKEAEMRKLVEKHYPADWLGTVMVVDEPEIELKFFISMMDYLGFRYRGV